VLLGFAFVFFWIVLSWDLSMSLDLHFQSTMYGWWFFMSAWVTALASFTILTAAWRRYLDRYDLITEKHFHDLGKHVVITEIKVTEKTGRCAHTFLKGSSP